MIAGLSILLLPGYLGTSGSSLTLIDPPEARTGTDTAASDPARVRVHGSGPGLVRPGRYVLPADGTVADLVQAAGGLRPDVPRSVVPWEHPLTEGLRLYVPRGPASRVPDPIGPRKDRWSKESSVWYDTAPVNVNRASTETLSTLPGIGPVLSRRLVADRRREGPFGSVQALKRVHGIGERTVRRLRRRVTVSPVPRSDSPGRDASRPDEPSP